MYIHIVSYHINHNMFQNDDAQPPTPPRSSPVRREGRNVNSSPATQRRNPSPAAQRGRSRSSSLYLTPSPRPNRLQRTPPQSNARPATSSPTRVPLTASRRSNIPRAQGNAQRHQPVQPPNAIASSSRVSGHQAPPPPATTSTSRTKGKTAPAAKRRKKNW